MDIGIQHLIKELSLYQIMFLNSFFALVFMVLASLGTYWLKNNHNGELVAKFWRFLSNWRPRRYGLHIAMGAVLLLSDILIFLSLRYHSLAEMYTLVLTTPLFAALLARLIYKEMISVPKWLCIGGGFVVSVWVLSPSYGGFSLVLAGVLFAAFMFALWFLLIKYYAPDESVMALFLSSRILGVIVLAIPSLLFWQPLTEGQLIVNIGNGLCYFLGYVFIIVATRIGAVSTVASLNYTQLPMGIAADALLYSIYPSLGLLCAGTLIVFAGLSVVMIDSRAERLQLLGSGNS